METLRALLGMFLGEETDYTRLHRTTFIVSMSALAVVAAGWGVWETIRYLHHTASVPTTELWLPWACTLGCTLCALVAAWWGHERHHLTNTPHN